MMQIPSKTDELFYTKVQEFCDRIQAECAGLRSLQFVRNISDRSKDFNHAVVSSFDTSEAHDFYQITPAHLEFKEFIMPLVKNLVVLDYQAS
jgi:hypothetical protein